MPVIIIKGEITDVLLGTVTALITVKVGDNFVESVITKRSAEELGLKKGDKVTAVIKATEVMIQKDRESAAAGPVGYVRRF